MKPFIFCIGLPATGKTTNSKLLEENLDGYFRLSIPELYEELGLEPYDKSGKGRELVDEAFGEIEKRIQEGEGMIIDRAGSRRDIRQSHYDWASHYGVDVLVVYHTASEQTAKSRMSNRPDPEKTSLPTNDTKEYDRLLKMLDGPEEDLKLGQNGHVSMIKYDTERNQLYPIRINESVQPLADRVTNILSTHSPSTN